MRYHSTRKIDSIRRGEKLASTRARRKQSQAFKHGTAKQWRAARTRSARAAHKAVTGRYK